MDTNQKRQVRRLLAGLLAAGVLAPAGARAAAPAPNVIRGIDVSERGGAVELDIRGSRAPSYTVFKLQDPPRLVVDVAGGTSPRCPRPWASRRGACSASPPHSTRTRRARWAASSWPSTVRLATR